MADIEDNIRYGEAVQEMMGKNPAWIVRTGSIITFVWIVSLFALALWIRYPETLDGTIVITSNAPPVELVSKASGRITFFVSNDESVKQDQLIAIIESSASFKELAELDNTMALFQKMVKNPTRIQSKIDSIPQFTNLGRFQNSYNAFVNNLYKYQITDRKESLNLEIMNSYNTLAAEFKAYKEDFFITSPIDGSVSFFEYWSNNQYVQSGDRIAYIVTKPKDIYGKLVVKDNKFCKVKIGQKVRIKLNSYPVSEYGMLIGSVSNTSKVNRDNMYSVDVTLDKSLTTTYRKKILFNNEMRGIGEIVTEDVSLLERIFYNIRSIGKKQFVD